MNESLKSFQAVMQSIEQVLSDEKSSVEIKQSALSLKNSIQPCLETIKHAAIGLDSLTPICLGNLESAQNNWQSKPKIALISNSELLEELGNLSGFIVKIRERGDRYKNATIKQVQDLWHKKILEFKNKWFLDKEKNEWKQSTHFLDRDSFAKELRNLIETTNESLRKLLGEALQFFYLQEISDLRFNQIDKIQKLLQSLDSEQQEKWNKEMKSILMSSKFNKEFDNSFNYQILSREEYTKKFHYPVDHLLKTNLFGNLFGISLENLEEFIKTINSSLEETINSVFDEQIKFIIEAIEKVMTFYNEFLEKQSRYQQETLEQRDSEKRWIENQRQQLQQIQKEIEETLNLIAKYDRAQA